MMQERSAFAVLTVILCLPIGAAPAQQPFLRGDVNGDGVVSLADIHFLARFIYLSSDPSSCMNAGDVNDDGCIYFSDLRYFFEVLRNGKHMPPPFPLAGPDPTPNDCAGFSYIEANCVTYPGPGPLIDPAAELIVLEAVPSGIPESTEIDITIGVSSSREIAGYRGVLRAAGLIGNYSGPRDSLSGRALPVDLSGSGLNDTWLAGSAIIRPTSETFEFGFLRGPPITTTWISPGQDLPVLQFRVCPADGVEAGDHLVELIGGELVDAETGRSISPSLVNGVLSLDWDVGPGLGCPGVEEPECGPPTADLGDLRVEMSLPDVLALPGQAVSIPMTIHSTADVRQYAFCMTFDDGIFDDSRTTLSFEFEKPDGTSYSRASWLAFPRCSQADDGVTADAWFSFGDDCNNLPAGQEVVACRLNLHVLPDALPASYDLTFLEGGVYLVYDRVLPRDRPDGLSLRHGRVVVPPEATRFRRGDANADGSVDISDPISVLGVLFLGDTLERCPDASDANDDGHVDLSDAVHVLSFLFQGGADPPAPGPLQCAEDPSDDLLGPCFYDTRGC